MLVAGLEPARCCHRGILSPLRLPIPPHQRDAVTLRITLHMLTVMCKWMEVDSNHRSNLQQIYSLSPLATRESIHAVRYLLTMKNCSIDSCVLQGFLSAEPKNIFVCQRNLLFRRLQLPALDIIDIHVIISTTISKAAFPISCRSTAHDS